MIYYTAYTEPENELVKPGRANKDITVIGFNKQKPQGFHFKCPNCRTGLVRINDDWFCPISCGPINPATYQVQEILYYMSQAL